MKQTKKLIIESWNVCRFAAEERKRLDKEAQKISATVMGGRGGRNRMQSWRAHMDRIARI